MAVNWAVFGGELMTQDTSLTLQCPASLSHLEESAGCTGRSGIEQVTLRQVDAVLVDIGLPDMLGTTWQELRPRLIRMFESSQSLVTEQPQTAPNPKKPPSMLIY